MESLFGLSSGCPVKKVLQKQSLNKCLKEACRVSTNVINYLPGVCELRKCEDVQNSEYTRTKGGWDVYVSWDTSVTQSSNLHVIIPAFVVPVVLTILFQVIWVYVGMTRKKRDNDRRDKSAENYPKVEYCNPNEEHDDNQVSTGCSDVNVYDTIHGEATYEQLNSQSRDIYLEPYVTVK